MRTDFIWNKDLETIEQYMTRGAEILRMMNAGELDLCMTHEEQEDVKSQIFTVALNEVKKAFPYMNLYKKGLHEDMEDFYAYFAEVLVKRLHTYNFADNLIRKDKKYRFVTFLNDLSGEVIRKTYAAKHGVPLYVEIELQRLKKIRKSVASSLGIYEEDVTPEMIAEASERSISPYEVKAIFEFTSHHKSLEHIIEEGTTLDKAFHDKEDVETDVFDVLEFDVRKVFDGFFSRLTDIEKYFVLVQVGCSDERLSMTYQQIGMDELFVAIVEADTKFSKNVSVGQVVVERPDRRSVKGYQKLVVENVKHVTFTFVQYMKPKTEKKLLILKNSLKMSDITGDCGISYFMKKWDELLKKYQ